jgi:hypothetical protein
MNAPFTDFVSVVPNWKKRKIALFFEREESYTKTYSRL